MQLSSNNTISYPNLYSAQKQTKMATLQSGVKLPRPEVYQDLLEISDNGRHIAVVENELAKINIPDRPKGAPDDYVKVNEIMKRSEPQTYEKMNEFHENRDWEAGLSLFINFAKKIPGNPNWLREYWKEVNN